MLHWTIAFFTIALFAGLFGFSAAAGIAASVAKSWFVVFSVLGLISLLGNRHGETETVTRRSGVFPHPASTRQKGIR